MADPRRRGALALCVLALLALCAAEYRAILGYGLFGHDTYTVIEASRIGSWRDLAGTFGEALMDGQFAIPYWRPVENLSVALDYALWGLAPAGYQASNLAVFAAAVLALFFLARRWIGGDALLGPLWAAAAFALFPSFVEILPVASRRNHTLCALFVALALRAQLAPRALSRPSVALGGLALLALGSNEIALVLAPLCTALAWLRVDAAGVARVRRALRASLPVWLATALVLAVRWQVLEGVGGPERVSLANLDKAERLAELVLFPQPGLERHELWRPVLLLAAAFGALALALDARRTGWRGSAARRAALPALVWLAAVALPIALAGVLRPWYAVHLAAALAVLLGAAAACLRAPGPRPQRLLVLGWLPLAAVLLGLALHGPLVRAPEQWERADRELERFLADLEARLPRATDGDVVRSLPVPVRALPQPRRQRDVVVRSPAIIGPLSIPSWLRLRFPERTICVAFSNEPLPATGTGVLLVLDVDAEP